MKRAFDDPNYHPPLWQKHPVPRAIFAAMIGTVLAGTMTPFASAQVPPGSSQPATGAPTSGDSAGTTAPSTGATANAPVMLEAVTVTVSFDAAIDQIAPSLGAVSYSIGSIQIQVMGQGEDAPFQQVLLQAPGMVQ
jgi:hypothetical protein